MKPGLAFPTGFHIVSFLLFLAFLNIIDIILMIRNYLFVPSLTYSRKFGSFETRWINDTFIQTPWLATALDKPYATLDPLDTEERRTRRTLQTDLGQTGRHSSYLLPLRTIMCEWFLVITRADPTCSNIGIRHTFAKLKQSPYSFSADSFLHSFPPKGGSWILASPRCLVSD